ncbi:TPA: type VI secretion system baseplate subunit TssG [Salmonella enterica]|nr:type VI secretion system baseplate subunit TssG [Salmonella enterica]HAK8195228.1 type VI secretion system baseplate subunit TssG [Salmonella enterica]HAK8434576.1 type VI secretion system baseplate subunit TssG [Salmonella enterica]HAK8462324.1 type VI secretion system baseplate subunit TssG [Salmonella enterica]
MAGKSGSASADLSGQAEFSQMDICRRNFYSLVEALCRENPARNPDFPLRTAPSQEAILFRADTSLAFPCSDIKDLTRNQQGQFVMTTTFLGLTGSQSPLPGYYLEDIAQEAAQDESLVAELLNMFSHRWTQFVWQIWRKYRYYVCFRNGGTDVFSQRMFALVGLGSPGVRDRLAINHCKMLAYAGVLASPGRSPEVICSLISHCFDLPDVTMENWQLRKIDIPERQQNRLGVAVKKRNRFFTQKSTLGLNFTLGARVPDRSGKFLLCINNLSRERFLSFLPSGENFSPLSMFLSFILRDQLAWDLRLGLAPDQIGGMRLGDEKNTALGWTSFIGQPGQQPFITIKGRG